MDAKLIKKITNLEDKSLAKDILEELMHSLATSKYYADWKLSYMENNFDMNEHDKATYDDDSKEYEQIIDDFDLCRQEWEKLPAKKKKIK